MPTFDSVPPPQRPQKSDVFQFNVRRLPVEGGSEKGVSWERREYQLTVSRSEEIGEETMERARRCIEEQVRNRLGVLGFAFFVAPVLTWPRPVTDAFGPIVKSSREWT